MNTRGTKGDILCTSVQCVTFLTDRPGRQFSSPNRPEKHKLVRGHWDFASCQVSSNSIQWFKRSWKCFSQSDARAAILFSDRTEKHKLGGRRWDLASCQASLNTVQQFQRRSRKCEKLMTDRRRTDSRSKDRQRVITIVHLSLRLRSTKKCLNKMN